MSSVSTFNIVIASSSPTIVLPTCSSNPMLSCFALSTITGCNSCLPDDAKTYVLASVCKPVFFRWLQCTCCFLKLENCYGGKTMGLHTSTRQADRITRRVSMALSCTLAQLQGFSCSSFLLVLAFLIHVSILYFDHFPYQQCFKVFSLALLFSCLLLCLALLSSSIAFTSFNHDLSTSCFFFTYHTTV